MSPPIYRTPPGGWPEDAYWIKRNWFRYYRLAADWVRRYVPTAQSLLDVGSLDCEYIRWLDRIPYRQRIDLQVLAPMEGVVTTRGDFLEYQPDRRFSVVMCLQVLEHVEDPAVFCRKLFATGEAVLISVPYKWPPDAESYHEHDPVDEEKLLGWAGRPWIAHAVVSEGEGPCSERLLALFPGDDCPPETLRWMHLRAGLDRALRLLEF